MRVRPFACQPVAGGAASAHLIGMAANDKSADREREERLAAALRDNLRKRKAQARELLKPNDGDQP